MFKRYILKNNIKQGPYFYHNFKTTDGKVKSIYLGKDQIKAQKKLEKLKEYLNLRKKEVKKQKVMIPTEQVDHTHNQVEKKIMKNKTDISLEEIHDLLSELDQINKKLK
ncbi:hypothetical protein HN587_05310 [Candidatus Woesearchaeota archaeon]|jgi:hypothetical protein|nr:hypothetical protein [Candidatus Woesearchaeota archaeon]